MIEVSDLTLCQAKTKSFKIIKGYGRIVNSKTLASKYFIKGKDGSIY